MDKFSLFVTLGVLALLAVTRAMPQSGSNSSSEEPTESRETMEESTEPHKYMHCISEVRDKMAECTLPFAAQSEDSNSLNLTPTQLEALSKVGQCVQKKLDDCKART